MATEEEVRARLDELPGDPVAIADFLRYHGIKGVRRSASQCPITRWTGGFSTIGVAVYPNLASKGVTTTTAIFEFVTRFDRGEFPDLVE